MQRRDASVTAPTAAPILVTGGAGFIGSALVRALVAEGQAVVTVDKLTYAGSLLNIATALDAPHHRFVRADIGDRAAMRRILAECRPRAVMHLAAESHVDRSIDTPGAFIATNVMGTATLLDAALEFWRGAAPAERDAFRFLQVSTDEVYGTLGATGMFDEASPYRPSSPYAASKAAADHLVGAYGRTYGLPVLITNCSNNYGPHQFPEKLLPLMILNMLEHRPLPVYGRGQQIRDWLHVDDHVAALRLVLERGRAGETYLIGARQEWRNLDLVHAVCGVMDRLRPARARHAELISFVEDRPGHDLRYAIDPGKIHRELGWTAAVSFATGLAATVTWYLENRRWCDEIATRYHRERLGSGAGAAAAQAQQSASQ